MRFQFACFTTNPSQAKNKKQTKKPTNPANIRSREFVAFPIK